jgi:hypothetical protein
MVGGSTLCMQCQWSRLPCWLISVWGNCSGAIQAVAQKSHHRMPRAAVGAQQIHALYRIAYFSHVRCDARKVILICYVASRFPLLVCLSVWRHSSAVDIYMHESNFRLKGAVHLEKSPCRAEQHRCARKTQCEHEGCAIALERRRRCCC